MQTLFKLKGEEGENELYQKGRNHDPPLHPLALRSVS